MSTSRATLPNRLRLSKLRGMSIKTVEPKTIIFREGELGDAAYIIQSGAVEILKHAEHGEIQLAILDAGDVLGEMALFEPKNSRSATARALTPVTLEVIEDARFKQLSGQCPPQILQIVQSVLTRLRDTNQRLAAKERATVILDAQIDDITIAPNSAGLAFEPVTVKAANLPFTIGGYPQTEEAPKRNHLDIPCDGPPLMVSQQHAKIERQSDGIYFVDLGSRFCSIVNGKVIGRGKASEKAELLIGENKITLGDHTSVYKLLITCE